MVSAWIVSTITVSVLVMVACDPCVSPGESLVASSGFFSSPNFPANFPNNSNCTWNITVPAGKIIKLTFLNFTLKSSFCSDGPRVLITNVASDDGEAEFVICGTRLPSPVYSDGNFIQVILQTFSIGYPGFNVTYEAIDPNTLCPRNVILTGASGVISSPYNPRKYPDNQNCSWKITAPQGHRVQLDINNRINIQTCRPCDCDYLQIKNGFSDNPKANGNICGAPGAITIYSIHENLEVLFVSDDKRSKLYDGFQAIYTQLNYTPPICPNEAIPLSGNNGKLSSPNYPMSNYPASRNCSWIITVPSGKLVKLVFAELALGSCQFNCTSDNCTNVELYDGSSTNSPSLGRFCNDSVLEDVYSSGNQMFVNFRSGSSLDRGFEAQYSVSSGTTTATTTTTTTTLRRTTTPTTTTTTTTTAPSPKATTKPTSKPFPYAAAVGTPIAVGAALIAAVGAYYRWGKKKQKSGVYLVAGSDDKVMKLKTLACVNENLPTCG